MTEEQETGLRLLNMEAVAEAIFKALEDEGCEVWLTNYRVTTGNKPEAVAMMGRHQAAQWLAKAIAIEVDLSAAEPLRGLYAQAEGIRALGRDWRTDGSDPLDADTIDRGVKFIERVQMVPCHHGGIQLEWHWQGYDLEIEFYPDGKVAVFLAAEHKLVAQNKEGK